MMFTKQQVVVFCDGDKSKPYKVIDHIGRTKVVIEGRGGELITANILSLEPYSVSADTYKYEDWPLTKDEYVAKVDYRSYFRLIGVKNEDSEKFHIDAEKEDLYGAVLHIKNTF